MAAPLDVKAWVTHVQPPRVERMLKAAAQSSAISFAGGLPAEELFPVTALEGAFQTVIANNAQEALQYTWSEGYEPLREQIAQLMRTRGVQATPQQILITHGAQQALDLLAKTFVRFGEHIALESPTYVPAIQAFELQRPRFLPVPRTPERLEHTALEEALLRKPALFYVVSVGHNPTGGILPLAERRRILDAMRASETYLIEDDVYGALQFDTAEPAICSELREFGRCVYVGSFSKILTPGLRIGWLAGDEALVKQLGLVKQASDLQTSTLNQMALSEFLKQHSLPEHIQRCVAVYRSRRDAMTDALRRHAPAEVKWFSPQAAFSIWLELPQHCNAEELLKLAMARGVAFEPGAPFFPGERKQHFLRLSYSNHDEAQIASGVRRLGDAMKQQLREGASACGIQ